MSDLRVGIGADAHALKAGVPLGKLALVQPTPKLAAD